MAETEYTNKVNGILANGYACLGISMGTRLGLFEGLSKLAQSKETAVSTQTLADSMNFKERYVREWINGMALAGILSHEEIDGEDRYWTEPHTLPTLLGDDTTWIAQSAELLTGVAEKQVAVEKCFPVDGPRGTDVDEYPVLHEFLLRRSVMWKSPGIIHKVFEDEVLLSKLEKGISVVEVGCGAAIPTKTLATRYPQCKLLATDICADNLERAKTTCQGLENVELRVMDACNASSDLNEKFDLAMMFDVYHDVPYPDKLIAGIHRILKPGGMLLMNDIGAHESITANKEENAAMFGMYYTISSLYCMPTSYKYPDGAGIGACGGMELYERKLKDVFTDVRKVAKDIGLFFLCTK